MRCVNEERKVASAIQHQVFEGRSFSARRFVSVSSSPQLAAEGARTGTWRGEVHAVRPGNHPTSEIDVGQISTLFEPGRNQLDRSRPTGPAAWKLQPTASREPLPRRAISITPWCIDDRPDIARPAGQTCGTGFFRAQVDGKWGAAPVQRAEQSSNSMWSVRLARQGRKLL